MWWVEELSAEEREVCCLLVGSNTEWAGSLHGDKDCVIGLVDTTVC